MAGHVEQSGCVNSHSQAPPLDLAVGLAAPQTRGLNGGWVYPQPKNMSTGKIQKFKITNIN